MPGYIFGVDYAEYDSRQTFLQYNSLSWDVLTLELWTPLLTGGRLLKCTPPTTAGVLIPGFVLLGLAVLPYVDRNPSRAYADRKMAIVTFTMFAVFWAFITLAGSFFRGPGWVWVWPWNAMYFDL